MADVIIGFKVMPKSIDVNLDVLEAEIKKAINPNRMHREPIAFGLVALHVTLLIKDESGTLENVEKKLRAIENVGEVEVTGMTRSL
jgi:translation elongation factor aEF-1 beta